MRAQLGGTETGEGAQEGPDGGPGGGDNVDGGEIGHGDDDVVGVPLSLLGLSRWGVLRGK